MPIIKKKHLRLLFGHSRHHLLLSLLVDVGSLRVLHELLLPPGVFLLQGVFQFLLFLQRVAFLVIPADQALALFTVALPDENNGSRSCIFQ